MNAHEVPGGHVFRPDMFVLDLDGIIARLRHASIAASGSAAHPDPDCARLIASSRRSPSAADTPATSNAGATEHGSAVAISRRYVLTPGSDAMPPPGIRD